jgi:hypothetical protein
VNAAFTLRRAVAEIVEGDDTMMRRQPLDRAFLPVGDAAAAAMHEEDRRTRAHVDVVDPTGVGGNKIRSGRGLQVAPVDCLNLRSHSDPNDIERTEHDADGYQPDNDHAHDALLSKSGYQPQCCKRMR